MPTEVITRKEHPIIFSSPMVRAILDGRKTQTRRLIKPQPTQPLAGHVIYSTDRSQSNKWRFAENDDHGGEYFRCPYGLPGDRLWVRETYCHKAEDGYPVYNADENLDPSCYHYAADGYYVMKCDGDGGMELTKSGLEASPWKSPIFMPRHASRITLEVVSVRVERLHEITDEDAIRDGMYEFKLTTGSVFGFDPRGTPGPDLGSTAVGAFAALWKKINGAESWDANPWVWRVEFKRVQQ